MADKAGKVQQLEKSRISSTQLAMLMVTLVISTADVFLPAFVAQEAGRDSWIAVLVGTLLSIPVIYIFTTLGLKYPGKTFIQYSHEILGAPLGWLAGAVFTYYLFESVRAIANELGELYIVAFNPDAPIVIYMAIVIIVAAYAVYSGIEVIGRINYLLLPLGLGILLVITLINVPKIDLSSFLPILYDGIKPTIRGGILIQGWLVEIVVILQLIPFISDKQNIRRDIMLSVVVLSLGLEAGSLTIAVFGALTAKFLFPALQFVRYAALGEYFRNLDIMILGVWIAGIFIKLTIFYYVFVLSVAQLFRLRSYKPLILPAGMLIVIMASYSPKTFAEMLYFLHFIYPFFSFSIAFILPSTLYLISLIKERLKTAAS